MSHLSRYKKLKQSQMEVLLRQHHIEPKATPKEMMEQLLELDVAEQAKRGITDIGIAHPPLLPHHDRRGDLQDLQAYINKFVGWSIHNREMVRDRKPDDRITDEEFVRLEAYIQAENEVLAPIPTSLNVDAERTKRWRHFLERAEDIGVYAYEYREVENPGQDASTQKLYQALTAGLKAAKEKEEYAEEMRKLKEKQQADKEKEAARLKQQKAARKKEKEDFDDDFLICACVIL